MGRDRGGGAEAFALASALGSLALLGGFLIVDGYVDIFTLVESYAKTRTWVAIAALPLIVLTYLIGLFVELLASALLPRLAAFLSTRTFEVTENSDFLSLAALGNDAVMQRYSALIRDRQLLDGAALPLMLLGLGAFSEHDRLMHEVGRGVGPVVTLIGLAALASGVLAPWAGHLKGRAAKAFAASAVEAIPRPKPKE